MPVRAVHPVAFAVADAVTTNASIKSPVMVPVGFAQAVDPAPPAVVIDESI